MFELQLPGYLQEVAGAFEASLASPSAPAVDSQPTPDLPAGLALQPSRALVQGLQQCCSRQVWLPPLTDRFMRLILQLLTCYSSWLHDGLAARSQRPPPPMPSTAEPVEQVGARHPAVWHMDSGLDLPWPASQFPVLPRHTTRP